MLVDSVKRYCLQNVIEYLIGTEVDVNLKYLCKETNTIMDFG